MLIGSRPPTAGPIRFSLDEMPERERPVVFREFLRRLGLRLEAESLHGAPFAVDAALQSLPGLLPFSGVRTGWMLSGGDDNCTLLVNLGGPYVLSQGRREIVLGDGEATFATCTEPTSHTHYPPGHVLAFRFPPAPFASLVVRMEDCYFRRIPRDTPALRLLRNYVDMAWDEQTMASHVLQHIVVAHVYDLMAVAVGATRDAAEAARHGGLRAARLHAIKQDIADNLDQADLSVAALALRHGCTPRFIQRQFESEGTTFTEYVLTQRLARAHRVLSDPRRAGEKITTAAYEAGFGDLSYFNRVFRRRYGAAPSEIRLEARRLDA
jgi:AraC-like DNA-binding protein